MLWSLRGVKLRELISRLLQVANYDLTGYTAEMQYIPEQVHKKSSRGPASLRSIAGKSSSQVSGHFAGHKFDLSKGQPVHHQTARYENHPSLRFDKSKYVSPAAFAAALAGKRNASKPRVGAAQSRFMTSNDKGQLMVGMAADTSSAAGQTFQNPRPTGLPAEGVFRTQFEMSMQAMDGEPADIPDLRFAEDFEAQNNTSALERNQRARRPSARARESLQLAMEMAQSTEITPEKPRGKKVQFSRSSRNQADQVEDERERGGEKDGKSSYLSWPAQDTRIEAPAAAAELIGFCIRQGNDLVHLNNPKLVSNSRLFRVTGIFKVINIVAAVMARSRAQNPYSRNRFQTSTGRAGSLWIGDFDHRRCATGTT